jgi:hypothetical protein
VVVDIGGVPLHYISENFRHIGSCIRTGVEKDLEGEPVLSWRKPVKVLALKLVDME